MGLIEQIERSAEIVNKAIADYQPKHIVSLVSGGNDSLTAFYVAQRLEVPVDRILHVYTGCGVQETRQFVEQWADTTGIPLLLCDAGDAYERYVMRKGFFGKGQSAHAMAYHVLKAGPMRKGISSIRQRRRDFPVLMLTGIRLDESDNRMYNFASSTVERDPGATNNIFVNLIEHWTETDCREMLQAVNAPRNPVSRACHRSAECMCGTMQSNEDRELVGILYPDWKHKIDDLEARALKKHGWGWGENMPASIKQERSGQMPIWEAGGFQLCRHCLAGDSASD